MAEYYGYITRLSNIKPHDNADNLQLCMCFNNQVVIDKGMKEGDLIFYIPTDMQLGLEFCKENNLLRSQGGYLEDNKRNVRTIKLRGQFSDGLVLPVESLRKFTDISKLNPGDKIDVLNGVQIVTKYVPPINKNKHKSPSGQKQSNKKDVRERYPFFAEHCDTAQLDFNLDRFEPGDEIIITEKLHGTSSRTSKNIVQINKKDTIWNKFMWYVFKKKNRPEEDIVYISGTRKTILNTYNGGYYGSNEFRKCYHQDFETRDLLHEGEEIYGEIVGWINEDTTIMPICNNSKVKDKQFSHTYGDQTIFSYGCKRGENEMYIYRMTMTNREGYVVEYPFDLVKLRCEEMGLNVVPELDRFKFTTVEDLMNRVDRWLEQPSTIDPSHVMEGVVVRRNNSTKFDVYKKKSNYFKILEGIIKDDGVADIEEVESSENISENFQNNY